jgi:hypothetical protein
LDDGSIRLINSDRAVLSSPDQRTDVPCEVLPSKPKLSFDLQFTAGYLVTILKALAGEGNSLRILFTRRAARRPGQAVCFRTAYRPDH